VTRPAARLGLVAERDEQSAELLERLLSIAIARLAGQYVDGEFVFTTIGEPTPAGGWQLRDSGRSLRYAAIAALGLLRLPEAEQRSVLTGHTGEDLVGLLAKKLDDITGTGDVALVCWAAAAAGHSELPHAVTRLGQLDRQAGPVDVVSAAWAVSALVAARGQVDVEEHLAVARRRLLAAPGAGAYPHVIGGAPRGTARTWAVSPTRCTRSRRSPGCITARPIPRHWPRPTQSPGSSAALRGGRPVVVAL
jgi:hypothetical protein